MPEVPGPEASPSSAGWPRVQEDLQQEEKGLGGQGREGGQAFYFSSKGCTVHPTKEETGVGTHQPGSLPHRD